MNLLFIYRSEIVKCKQEVFMVIGVENCRCLQFNIYYCCRLGVAIWHCRCFGRTGKNKNISGRLGMGENISSKTDWTTYLKFVISGALNKSFDSILNNENKKNGYTRRHGCAGFKRNFIKCKLYRRDQKRKLFSKHFESKCQLNLRFIKTR